MMSIIHTAHDIKHSMINTFKIGKENIYLTFHIPQAAQKDLLRKYQCSIIGDISKYTNMMSEYTSF